MSIQTEIERLENAKSALKTSITNKGVTVNEEKKISEYSALVDSIVELKGQTKTVTPSTSEQTISPDAQYNGLTSVTVNAVTSAIDSNIVADNIKKDVSILGVTGTYALEEEIDTSDADATASDIVLNKTAYVNGEKITGTLPLFPNTSTFTVSNAGVTDNIEDSTLDLTTINTTKQILDSNVSMNFNAGYSDVATAIGLTAEKIASGNTILGVEGTATADADATADDIVVNKTAYVNGQKITGTIPTATTITEDGSVQLESDGQFKASATVPNDIYLHSDIAPRMIWLNLTKTQVANAIGLTADKIVSGNTILDIVGTASTGTTADTTIPQGEYGLETAISGEGDNDTGYKFYTNANVQSKLYETGSIVEVHITNELLAQVLGITTDKIKAGETIAGVLGTYTGTTEAAG